MKLQYFVQFKAAEGVDAQYALQNKLINIEGVAIDTSVNSNKWQVPSEDLDYFTSSLIGAQLRVDHAESALMVMGKVAKAERSGDQVLFRAEVGDEKLIEKILHNYVNHVSVQVDSDDVECSKCKQNSRSEGMLIHLCPGAWEIVHHPKVRELSIVASPAYENTAFKPVGFAAAMNEDQWNAATKKITDSQSLNSNKDGGSNREVQEPDDKTKLKAEKDVKHMSTKLDGEQVASPQQAAVVNVTDGEGAGKDVTYEDIMGQIESLSDSIKSVGGSGNKNASVDDLKKFRARVGKKIAALKKQLDESGDGEAEGEADAEAEAKKGKKADADAEGEAEGCDKPAEAKRASHGAGVIPTDEMAVKTDAGQYGWFKDLLKANKKMVGIQ